MRSWLRIIAIVVPVLLAACGSKRPEAAKQEYVASGDRYAAQHKYKEAIIQYRNAIAVDARFGEARLKLADTYQKSADLQGALREYVRAADLMPDNAEAQVKAGNLLLLAGMYPEAQARAQAALAKQPKNAAALILLGDALAGLKNIDGAITQLESAVDIDKQPQMTLSYANLGWLEARKGDAAAAEGAFKKAIELHPDSLAARLNIANFYWATQRWTDAEREMKAALALDAKSVEANRLLAAFYLNRRERAAAEPYLKMLAGVATSMEPKLTLADFYLADGRTSEAATILEPLLKDTNAFAPAMLRLAAIHYYGGDKSRGYDEVEQVLKRVPNDELALFVKARLLITDRRFAEALPIATAAVQRNPKSVRMFYIRATAARALGRLDEAIDAMRTGLQLMPSSIVGQGFLAELYLQRGEAKGALDLANQVVKASPNSPAAHFLVARALLQSGNADAAEREFVRLASTDLSKASPDMSEGSIQTWLGRTYLAKDDRAKARRAFARAFELDPTSLLALNGLVTLDVVGGDAPAATSKLEAQLAKDPRNAALVYLAANTYFTMGNMPRAEALFQEAIKLQPNDVESYIKLGTLYAQSHRLDEAKKKFEEASLKGQASVTAFTLRGMVAELQKNPDEAKKLYEKALAIDPRAAVAANNLAWLYADRGENLDVALQLAQTAKSVVPDDASVSNTLGWVYYKKGLFTEAVTALKESADRSPKNPVRQYYLGLAYLKAKRPNDARRALEHALAINPQFAQADDARHTLASIKG